MDVVIIVFIINEALFWTVKYMRTFLDRLGGFFHPKREKKERERKERDRESECERERERDILTDRQTDI